jgi:hypothetical protein
MSPRIRLQCYPEDDPQFVSGVTLETELDIDGHIVDAVLTRLRPRYPLVEIVVDQDGDPVVWHVFRDGSSAA